MPQPADIAHLLRRAGFGGSKAQISALAAQPWATTVDQLLDFSNAPADVAPTYLYDQAVQDWDAESRLVLWWMDRMATSSAPLQEKLTLFWHGHFANSNDKVSDMRLMYDQNALFRKMATGNFRDLVHQMSVQPAMLVFLDNAVNIAGAPNENFARELMELFTLGVDQYTQADIVASARAWTGHNLQWLTPPHGPASYLFRTNRHDYGMKTFMGVTRNWDGPDIIDFILRDDATHKQIAANFIAAKMWGFFAYPNPEPAVLSNISSAFLSSDLSIHALVRAIFMHPQFISTKAKQGLVRTPVEWVINIMKSLGFAAGSVVPQQWDMADQGQKLFEPPNVSGWRPNEYWITMARAWSRANWVRYLDWTFENAKHVLGEITTMTVHDAVQHAFDVFGIDTPSANTRAKLEAWLTAERAATSMVSGTTYMNLVTLTALCPESILV